MDNDLIKLLKKEAKFIAARALVDEDLEIPYSKALERLSNELGFSDWNELRRVASIDPNTIYVLMGLDCVETDDEFENRGNQLSRTGDE